MNSTGRLKFHAATCSWSAFETIAERTRPRAFNTSRVSGYSSIVVVTWKKSSTYGAASAPTSNCRSTRGKICASISRSVRNGASCVASK